MSIFNLRNKDDLMAEAMFSIARLEQRIDALSRAIGKRGHPWEHLMLHINSDGRVAQSASIMDELEAIKSHIGINIKPNPDADKKWVAVKVAKK